MPSLSLSIKAKEAIKVALAFVLAYAIALNVSWMNPTWAGFAVGMIAVAPAGQSIHKGLLRLSGTIPGALAAIVIFSVAPQERWLFIGLASAWMTFATYMMIKDDKRAYMWNVAGFVCLVILITNPNSSAQLFDYAIARALETALGVIVYTLVTVFLWPHTNINSLKQLSQDLISTQAKLFALKPSDLNTQEAQKSLQNLREHEIQTLAALKQAFYAQGSESYEVREASAIWNQLHTLSTEVMQTLNRFHNGFSGLSNIDIYKLLPELDGYKQEIARRFNQTTKEFGQESLDDAPKAIHLDINKSYLKTLTPLDQIAFSASKKELQRIDELSLKLLECSKQLMDKSSSPNLSSSERVNKTTLREHIVPDLDNLKNALFIGLATLVSFSIWIFFDPPGHQNWVQLPPTIAMTVASIPQLKVKMLIAPLAVFLSIFLAVYVLIMPQLSSFIGLGSLLFISMFLVMYYLPGMAKLLGVVAILMELPIQNQQTYDFAVQANAFIFTIFTFILVYIFSYLLSSPRPQKVVPKLLNRYFRSAEFLISQIHSHPKKNILEDFSHAFHTYEIASLPAKISSWAKAIDSTYFSQNTPEQVQDLLAAIHSLSFTLQELVRTSHLTQPRQLSQEVKNEVKSLKTNIQSIFQDYQVSLGTSLSAQIDLDYKTHIKNLAEQINKDLNSLSFGSITNEEKENFFQLLGSLHGLNLALVSYATVAETTNWKSWEEEVFA